MANTHLSFYNISAPTVIAPPSPLNFVTELVGYIVETPGSAGNLIFNDAATLAAANATNQILSNPSSITYGAIGDGSSLNIPVRNGLVVSSVCTGIAGGEHPANREKSQKRASWR